MSQVHSVTASIGDAAPAGGVGTSAWNAEHWVTLASSETLRDYGRTVIDGTNRIVLAGSARYYTLDQPPVPYLGQYGLGTLVIGADQFLLQYKRASLAGNARTSLLSNAELFIFNLAPVGRLVLAGGPT